MRFKVLRTGTGTTADLQQHLTTAKLMLNRQQQVKDALAVAAYHAQTQVPVLGWLLGDDAAVYESAHGHPRVVLGA